MLNGVVHTSGVMASRVTLIEMRGARGRHTGRLGGRHKGAMIEKENMYSINGIGVVQHSCGRLVREQPAVQRPKRPS